MWREREKVARALEEERRRSGVCLVGASIASEMSRLRQRPLYGATTKPGTARSSMCEFLQNQSLNEHFLAAVAAAILGAQGSPAWSRTAEALLLGDPEVKRLFRLAAREIDAALGSP